MRESVILPVRVLMHKDVREKRSKSEVIYLAAVPPTGFEPVLLPPEGSALSPELRGLIGQFPNLQQKSHSMLRWLLR